MTGFPTCAAGGSGSIGPGRLARACTRLLALSLVLVLAACASVAPAPLAPGNGAAPATSEVAAEPDVWSGRFSLITTGGKHSNSWSGRYALTRAPGAGSWSLTLFSPLGSVLAQCDWGDHYARFTVPDAGGLRTESGPDPETLALSLLGWPLPLSRFPDWIEGRPSATLPAQWDEQGALVAQFQQQGWVVRTEHDASGALRRLDFLFEPGTDALTRVRLRLIPGAAS